MTQWYGSARSSKWAQIIRGHSDRREACRAFLNLHAGIVRRILNHVKRNVAEVSLVTHAVAATDAGLPISKDVISEANARRDRSVVWIPK